MDDAEAMMSARRAVVILVMEECLGKCVDHFRGEVE
jgi:hypothetical protein